MDQTSADNVNLNRGAVGGAMYQRLIGETFSVGIQAQTNQTVLGVVGFDF